MLANHERKGKKNKYDSLTWRSSANWDSSGPSAWASGTGAGCWNFAAPGAASRAPATCANRSHPNSAAKTKGEAAFGFRWSAPFFRILAIFGSVSLPLFAPHCLRF